MKVRKNLPKARLTGQEYTGTPEKSIGDQYR